MQLELFQDEDQLLLKEKLEKLTKMFNEFTFSHYQSKKSFKEYSLESRLNIHLLKQDIIKELESLST